MLSKPVQCPIRPRYLEYQTHTPSLSITHNTSLFVIHTHSLSITHNPSLFIPLSLHLHHTQHLSLLSITHSTAPLSLSHAKQPSFFITHFDSHIHTLFTHTSALHNTQSLSLPHPTDLSFKYTLTHNSLSTTHHTSLSITHKTSYLTTHNTTLFVHHTL